MTVNILSTRFGGWVQNISTVAKVLGLASIADDVSPELALETIESIEVLGAFRASLAVKAALAGRLQST